MKKILAVAALLAATNVAQASNALAVIQNAQGNVNHTIKVFAQFTYDIQNPTNSYQNYAGIERIEVAGQKFENPISFSLPPRGSYRKSDPAILNFKANNVGEFKSKATISIAGNVGAAHSSNGKVTVKP